MYSSHDHFHSHILFLSYNLSVQTKSRNEENPETFVLHTLWTVSIVNSDYKLIDRIFRKYHRYGNHPDVSNIQRKKANKVLEEYQKSENGLKILNLSRIYLLWHYVHHYYLAVIVNLKKIDPTCKQEYG